MTARELLGSLKGVKGKTSGGWVACCPAHEDKKASLSIDESPDGKILLKCFAGCETGTICRALGIKLEDLFQDSLATRGVLARKIIATYDYVDEHGHPLFQSVRYDPKDFSQRHADLQAPGGWVWNLKGVRRVLYRLPDVLKSIQAGLPVLFVEGEKDADNLAAKGFCSTTNPMGAGKWDDEYTRILTNSDLVLIPDKDPPGLAHAQRIASLVHPVAKRIRILHLPFNNGHPGKDISDWFGQGNTREALVELIDGVRDYVPEIQPVSSAFPESQNANDYGKRWEAEISESLSAPPKNTLPLILGASALLADETVLLPPEIIRGILHQGLKGVIGGASKSRKSWSLLDLGVSVNCGVPWWGFDTEAGRVLYLNFEIPTPFLRARLQIVLEAKARQAGKPLNLDWLDVWNLRGYAASLDLLVPEIIRTIEAKHYKLVLIDPIYKGLGGRDENAAGDVAQVCNEVERLAVQTGAAVVFSAHFSKGNQAGKEAIDRIGGSGVWARDPDTIIILTRHEEEDCYSVDLTLRNLPEKQPFVVQWKFPFMERRMDLDPEDLKLIKGVGRPPAYEVTDMLALLPPEGLALRSWFKEAQEELGMPRSTFYRLKAQLEKQDKITKSCTNGKFQPVVPKFPK